MWVSCGDVLMTTSCCSVVSHAFVVAFLLERTQTLKSKLDQSSGRLTESWIRSFILLTFLCIRCFTSLS